VATEKNPKASQRRRPLKTVRHLREFAAQTLRDLEEHGSPGDPDVARTIFAGIKLMSELLTAYQLERRLAKMEEGRAEQAQVQ
jgi:hypothetical protein